MVSELCAEMAALASTTLSRSALCLPLPLPCKQAPPCLPLAALAATRAKGSSAPHPETEADDHRGAARKEAEEDETIRSPVRFHGRELLFLSSFSPSPLTPRMWLW